LIALRLEIDISIRANNSGSYILIDHVLASLVESLSADIDDDDIAVVAVKWQRLKKSCIDIFFVFQIKSLIGMMIRKMAEEAV